MRIETRGPERGICNLCGKEAKLTEDHIPPKQVPRVGQSELMHLIDYMQVEPANQSKQTRRFFQRGVKFRSICGHCNNERLGARYDPELISFTHQIAGALHQRLFLPIDADVRINRLARSVVGHQLAHGLGTHRRGEVIDQLTDYFLDESVPFPANLHFYCWLYPYNDQVVANAAVGYFDFAVHQHPVFFLLQKYFPVGFLITQGELPPTAYEIVQLDTALDGNIDAPARVRLPLNIPPPHRWPEAPGENGAIMHTQGASAARRR